MQRFINSPLSNVLSAPPCVVTTTSISSSSSVTTNCSSSNSTELISTPNRSSPSTPPILSLNAPSPQPSSFPSPSPSFPSPQPTLVPHFTNSKLGEKENTADGCQPSKKRKTVLYRNKSTQTETISTKVPETCNVCLTTQERGHWVGCDRTRCGYWVHDECMGFYFSSKTVVKKLNFYVPCTDKENNCYICNKILCILYFIKFFLLLFIIKLLMENTCIF